MYLPYWVLVTGNLYRTKDSIGSLFVKVLGIEKIVHISL